MLTGKAKEDFEIWYLKILRSKPEIQDRYWDENLLSFFWNSDDIMRNAYITEWFDSVNINIHTDIHTEFYEYKIYLENLVSPDYEDKFHHSVSRNYVRGKAIEKANEIYNSL